MKRKEKSPVKIGGGFASMCMSHLHSQVPQYGGFATGKRVSGGVPKIPLGAAVDPHFMDFMFFGEFHVTQTHDLLVKLRTIQRESLDIDFRGGI